MHGIATRIALVAALLAGGVGLAMAAIGGLSLLYPIIAAGLVGLGVRAAVHRHVTRPLSRLHEILADIRDHGDQRDETTASSENEVVQLIRKGDQARFAVEKRMSDLSKAERYRREYVGDVSHEITTPVFAIQGFAETLLGGALEDPEVNRGFVEKILHHATRLSALARDLSDISRLETGALQLSRGAVDSHRLFEEVRESLEHTLRQKNIGMIIDVADDAVWVDGDRDRLRQVLTNLADNAVKYNNPGGRVRLIARRDGDSVRWAVEDDGIGIATDDLDRVTERFYRADRSRSRSQGGTGLGLSIVKHLIAAHGAALHITSRPGEGSTFSFLLPDASRSVEIA